MTPDRLEELIADFARARIAVLGDYFLDKYLDVDPALAEPSLETGKSSHQVVGIHAAPGAAGTVVANLAALGCRSLRAIGYRGDDGEGYELQRGLQSLGCDTAALAVAPDRFTPTYHKPRDVDTPGLAGEHSRYDTKNRQPTPDRLQSRTVAALDDLLHGGQLDAVILADQVEEDDCGVVTKRVREALADRARTWPDVVFFADSRRRIGRFRHVLTKPNQFEAVARENPGPDDAVELEELLPALQAMRDQTGAPVCVTRGSAGMIVSEAAARGGTFGPVSVRGLPADGPTDPTGAGDSATAGIVLSLCVGATLPEACLVGNLVASITVQQLGTCGTANSKQLPKRLTKWLAGRQ
jgi:bifunctional ADP-heptose synthase (sugar kinase/adenylyltransferase)